MKSTFLILSTPYHGRLGQYVLSCFMVFVSVFITTSMLHAQVSLEGTLRWQIKVDFNSPETEKALQESLQPTDLSELEKSLQNPALQNNPALQKQLQQGLDFLKQQQSNGLKNLIPTHMTIYFKEHSYRVKSEGSSNPLLGDILFLKKENKRYLINSSQKTYSELPEEKNTSGQNKQYIPKATSEYQTVLGYKCRKYEVVEKDLKQYIWATKEIAGIGSSSLADLTNSAQTAEIDLSKIEGFPLKIEVFSPELNMTMTALSFDTNKVAAEHFVIPGTYQKKALPFSK
jgi:hypothetical protein